MSLAVSREFEVLNDNIFKISEHKRKRHRKVLGEESDILSPERRGFIFDNLMLSSSFMPSFFSATGSFTGIKLKRLLFNVRSTKIGFITGLYLQDMRPRVDKSLRGLAFHQPRLAHNRHTCEFDSN